MSLRRRFNRFRTGLPLPRFLERRRVARSGLFDADWYRSAHPELALPRERALDHYLDRGWTEGRNPNPLFDGNWYLARLPDPQTRRLNPLVHYLRRGASAGLDPGPLFDSDWYLAEYPDVRRAGWNPLAHYLTYGAAEGRRPRPDFDPAAYLAQLPPEERQAGPDPLVHFAAIGRARGYRFSHRDDLVRACRNGRLTLLIVSHNAAGGVGRHIDDLVALCRDHVNVLVIEPRAAPWIAVLPRAPEGPPLCFNWSEDRAELVRFLRDCAVARIHIHHLYNNEVYLKALVDELGLPFDFTVHDYYVLSPQPHLIGRDGCFVGEDLQAAEAELLDRGIARRRPASLAAWQAACRWLTAEAARIIVPSRDVECRLAARLPGLAMVRAAHPMAAAPAPVRPQRLAPRAPLRIALLGALAPYKGLDLLSSCARLARSRPLQFVVIGTVDRRYRRRLSRLGVTITGPYAPAELPRLVTEQRPDLLWFPAQCPETFSYTLSEGMALGLPIAATDLGALPERLGGRPWSWVLPWTTPAAGWVKFFDAIRAANFVTGAAPPVAGEPTDLTDAFYRADYLAWAAEPPAPPRAG